MLLVVGSAVAPVAAAAPVGKGEAVAGVATPDEAAAAAAAAPGAGVPSPDVGAGGGEVKSLRKLVLHEVTPQTMFLSDRTRVFINVRQSVSEGRHMFHHHHHQL